MSRLRVGILGAGVWSRQSHLPALESFPDLFDVKAVYSRSAQSCDALKAVSSPSITGGVDTFHEGNGGLDALLARGDIDAVVSALPITYQAAAVRKAWAAGKHVLSEKPVAGSFDEAKSLLQEYEAKHKPQGLVWHVAENYAHEPAFYVAQDLVKNVGKISYVHGTWAMFADPDNPFVGSDWRVNPQYVGGYVYDGGVHHAREMLIAMNEPIARVAGFAKCAWKHLAPLDTLNAVFQTDAGIDGTYNLSFGAGPTDSRNVVTVTGPKGHVTVTGGALPLGVPHSVGIHAGDGYRVEAFDDSGKIHDEWFAMDGVNLMFETFAKTCLHTATPDKSARGDPRRAMSELTFSQGIIESKGQLVELNERFPY